MSKQLKYYILLAFFYTISYPLSSQTPTAHFSTWKDNRKAAYTIIHDDYSNFLTSIFQYAYPLCTERGIKFSFGAITNTCGQKEWENARTMIAKGHECINHSHSHKCGGTSCGTLDRYGETDFTTELDLSTQLIESNTRTRPLFFIHPFDMFSDAIIKRLGQLGYIGTRAGERDAINKPDFSNYMYMNYHIYSGTPETLAALNPTIDEVIAKGGYAMREFHGIGDPYFGSISVQDYTNHVNYVKSKIDAGLLWSATATEVISYKLQRDAFQPVVKRDSKGKNYILSFTTLKNLTPSVFRTPVTLNIDLKDTLKNYVAYQNGTRLGRTNKGLLTVNIYPSSGDILFELDLPEAYVKSGLEKKKGDETIFQVLKVASETTSFSILYPNPAKDFVQIELKKLENDGIISIELVDSIGNIIKQAKIDVKEKLYYQLDLTNLNNGNYFVVCKGQNQQINIQKLIISK